MLTEEGFIEWVDSPGTDKLPKKPRQRQLICECTVRRLCTSDS